jgi:hypothetical protein
MADIFERLTARRPPPTERTQRPSQAQQLLDWLQRWDKPIVNRRDVRIYGPAAIRDRRAMINSAEVLVKNGWLTPVKARQHNGFKWMVVRRPIAHPTVAE